MNETIGWYYNLNLKPQGPFTFEEIKSRIQKGEIALNTLIQKEIERYWNPARSYKEFSPLLFPANQEIEWKYNIHEKKWVMLFRNNEGNFEQKGPMSIREVLDFNKSNKLLSDLYIWKSGLSGWALVSERYEFLPTPDDNNQLILT